MNWFTSQRLLPKPSGPFSVGFIDYEWKPPVTEHTQAPPAFALTRIFYPSGSSEEIARKDYENRCGKWLPSASYLPAYGYYLKIPRIMSIPIFHWLAGHLRLWAVEDAPVAESPPKLPVIVFSHGIGGIRTTYSSICTDLASHGFVVAAIEHRWLWRWLGRVNRQFTSIISPFLRKSTNANSVLSSDGSASMTIEQEVVKPYDRPEESLAEEEIHSFRSKQLSFRAEEVSANLDLLESIDRGDLPENILRQSSTQALLKFKGRIDLSKSVAIGHSFGAATSIFASAKDERIHSIICMDPWMYPFPHDFTFPRALPMLVINSESFHWPTNLRSINELLDCNRRLSSSVPSMMITLLKTGHMDQSDMVAALPKFALSKFRPVLGADPHVVLRNNNDVILAFLKDKAGFTWLQLGRTLPDPNSDPKEFEESFSCIIDLN